jgi:hypothetical protein
MMNASAPVTTAPTGQLQHRAKVDASLAQHTITEEGLEHFATSDSSASKTWTRIIVERYLMNVSLCDLSGLWFFLVVGMLLAQPQRSVPSLQDSIKGALTTQVCLVYLARRFQNSTRGIFPERAKRTPRPCGRLTPITNM